MAVKDKLGLQPELRKELKGVPAEAVEDLAGGADLATTVAKVNELLASLRTAGLLGE